MPLSFGCKATKIRYKNVNISTIICIRAKKSAIQITQLVFFIYTLAVRRKVLLSACPWLYRLGQLCRMQYSTKLFRQHILIAHLSLTISAENNMRKGLDYSLTKSHAVKPYSLTTIG